MNVVRFTLRNISLISLKQIITLLAVVVVLSFSFTSCIIVKEKSEPYSDIEPKAFLSPKPEIAMSDEIVRSNKGDMISQIPLGWFFVDVEDRISPDVLAVIVNKDYTLSAVFSHIRAIDNSTKVSDDGKLFDVARECLAKREKKTAGSVKLIGRYQNLTLGNKEFVKYEFSGTGGAVSGKAAVFESLSGEFYEFSLIPMNITGNQLPSAKEFDMIFRSFLAAIQY